MYIGLATASLADLYLDRLTETASELGIAGLEFGCRNWSSAGHLPVDMLLASGAARRTLLAKLRDHDFTITALNCSGNPLYPGRLGEEHRGVTTKTIHLARLMDVERVVMMSGCPGGPGDANANWVTTAWPPAASRFLSSQWDQVVILYGLIDVTPNEHRMDRAWSYRTLGRGHALSWWKQFRETTARRVWRRALNRA